MSPALKWSLIAASSALALGVGVWFFFFRGKKAEKKDETKAA